MTSLTVTDMFAGAGGSSTGMVAVPGVQVRMAANHWKLAIAVHNQNHPDTDHAPVDLHEEDPRYFPRTDILWASPECTKWSQAAGAATRPAIEDGLFQDPLSDEAAKRSRLLMFDVLRYAEHHRYRAMIVENVVDIATRKEYRVAWQVWQRQLRNLGYHYRVVSLNSMHAQALGLPAPQSRDRLYIVAWRKGERAPDIDRFMRPKARCPRCEQVIEARQAFKPGRTVGRYRAQYIYVHSACGTPVEPAWLPAAAAIDWSIPGTRIGDRPIKEFFDKQGNFLGRGHLAPKTIDRIAAGIALHWRPFTAEVAGHTFERRPGVRTWPIDEVLRTLHTTESKALLVPVEGRDGKEARLTALPGRTQTTRLETAMVTPPLHVSLMGSQESSIANSARPIDHELRTLTAGGNNDYLLTEPPSLITPAGGTWNDHATTTDEALRTLTTRDAYALVMRNNSGGAEMSTPAWEALRTLTTAGHQSLIEHPDHGEVTRADVFAGRWDRWGPKSSQPSGDPGRPVGPDDLDRAKELVGDCLFRMLHPHEIAAGMAFPRDYDWDVLDEKGRRPSNRNLVKMAGNAVTPPAARDLMAAVSEAITAEAVTP